MDYFDSMMNVGGKNIADGDLNSIFSFDTISHAWTHVGNMTQRRRIHGISFVNAMDVINYCSYSKN